MALVTKHICCAAELAFRPWPQISPVTGHTLFKIVHAAGDLTRYIRCLGKCSSDSGCPFCVDGFELGEALCQECGKRWEAMRNPKGVIVLIRSSGNIGPVYAVVNKDPAITDHCV